MWIPDLFMERVLADQTWSLMCPDACPGLSDVYGAEFQRLYEEYEEKGMYIKRLPAKDIWFRILESQIETGTPYIGFKASGDSVPIPLPRACCPWTPA